jgi:hypothetical protein
MRTVLRIVKASACVAVIALTVVLWLGSAVAIIYDGVNNEHVSSFVVRVTILVVVGMLPAIVAGIVYTHAKGRSIDRLQRALGDSAALSCALLFGFFVYGAI